ncbi:translationally-controlled tumor protein-like [Sciurus carolinensis]|uniref:translationally-controlled tumor protein-like n=1 Tax=Sciurus carolinensis TaxID=30640 RepID=UPI001FB4157D|nr:translationally-controlled tumor protein-like [Sciurus carolinensis]
MNYFNVPIDMTETEKIHSKCFVLERSHSLVGGWPLATSATTSPTRPQDSLLDLISHEEMLSDILKAAEITVGLCLEVEGKVARSTGVALPTCSLVEMPPSKAHREGAKAQQALVSTARNHHLQKTGPQKQPTSSGSEVAQDQSQTKHSPADFKSYRIFIGENTNPGGKVTLLDLREGGVTRRVILFKDDFQVEKC